MSDPSQANYLLFTGGQYYPWGGALDLVGAYKERGEAIDQARAFCRETSLSWWHIYAIDQGRIVAKGSNTITKNQLTYSEDLEV